MDTPNPAQRAEPDLTSIANQLARLSRENQQMFQRLLDGERRYRHLARAVWQVQEEERRRLARDLHDGLGQTLTALKNQLRREVLAAEGTDGSGGAPGVAGALDLADQALQDTRELSRLLCPPVLEELGLEAAVRWLVRIHGERGDLEVHLDWQVEDLPDDPDLHTLVFRLVQEALTNVVRHAGTGTADLDVSGGNHALHLAIADEGAGFDVEAALRGVDSSGLRGMRDRAALFGGTMEVHSAPGRGTRVAFRLPVAEQTGGIQA